jgi:Ca2+-binding RTX toxin-like protein
MLSFPRGSARRVVPVFIAAAILCATALSLTAGPSGAITKADHSDWPTINGALVLNRQNGNRPIDMRGGKDPFQHTDPSYSCDELHKNNLCFVKIGACAKKGNYCASPPVIPANLRKHNELLGGHGNDTIYAGAGGDVVWADYNYPTNPATQKDKLFGGPGNDFLYASHGHNEIHTGGGKDAVLARYGYGTITCDSAAAVVNLSRRSQKKYKLTGCKHITLKPVGTQKFPDR